MRINKDSLKARANNISKKYNITQNIVYNRFFFDAFLSRLAVSKYKDNLVLKGGLYLSSILGINERSTIDIDLHIKSTSMNKEMIINIINEIASINIGDSITFEIIVSKRIREEDLYGGFQINLIGKLDNIRNQFSIDVATGDPIVPSERNYRYECLVSGEVLPIKAYSLESVVAEKLVTLLSRGITNSRSKDFYDLYVLRKTQLANIDLSFLIEAYRQTCRYRKLIISKIETLNLLDEIIVSQPIKIRWTSYCSDSKYAYGLAFEDVIETIKEWIDDCYQ